MTRRQVIVLVGGSGFIGRYAVRQLAAAGHVLRIVCSRPSDALFLKTAGNVGQISISYGSLARPETMKDVLQGADGVVNLAGILHESGKKTFDTLHHRGAAALAGMAQDLGIKRLVHVSALAASLDSPSAYARSKAQGEQAVLQAFPKASIVRPSLVFGPEDNFFNLFAHLATISPALPLLAGGTTRFQPVYVQDVAKAITTLVLDDEHTLNPNKAGPRPDPCFELGGPEVATFRELLEMILATIHRRKMLIPLPGPLAKVAAAVLQWLPNPLLTLDQLKLLKTDSVVSGLYPTLEDLGIQATPMASIIPHYLQRFRPLSAS